MRMYQLPLRLFPPGFRKRNGVGLTQTFEAMRAEWNEEKGGTGPAFWASIVWDTASHATAEWSRLVFRGSERTATGGDLMASFWSDIRFSFRQLSRQPVYAGTVILLMALASGRYQAHSLSDISAPPSSWRC